MWCSSFQVIPVGREQVSLIPRISLPLTLQRDINPLTRSYSEPHPQMFRFHLGLLRLGRRGLSGSPISTDTYLRTPSTPLSFVSTHSSANFGTNPGLQSSSENLCSRPSVNLCDYGNWQLACQWKMVHQHPPGEICALSDIQVNVFDNCS